MRLGRSCRPNTYVSSDTALRYAEFGRFREQVCVDAPPPTSATSDMLCQLRAFGATTGAAHRRWFYILILLEFQSTVDRRMARRWTAPTDIGGLLAPAASTNCLDTFPASGIF